MDYDRLEETALVYRPKMIICGGSAYPREWDYQRLRKVHSFSVFRRSSIPLFEPSVLQWGL